MNALKYDVENQYHYNDDYIFFSKSFLSQWYGGFAEQNSKFSMQLNNCLKIEFNCAEQAMMYNKAILFEDFDVAAKIMSTLNPKEQKTLGRQVKNYNDAIWSTLRLNTIISISNAKFGQNEHLKKKLLDTENKTLVEASPWDTIWGIGMSVDDSEILDETKWKGQNLLGKALMITRMNLFRIEYGVYS